MKRNNEINEETIEISLNYQEANLIVTFVERLSEILYDNRNSIYIENKEYCAMLSSRIIGKIRNAIHEKGYE